MVQSNWKLLNLMGLEDSPEPEITAQLSRYLDFSILRHGTEDLSNLYSASWANKNLTVQKKKKKIKSVLKSLNF